MSFLEENGLADADQPFDAIKLAIFISSRLQDDNDWLVDKLASDVPETWRINRGECSEHINSEKLDTIARLIPSQDQITHYKSTLNDFNQLQAELSTLLSMEMPTRKKKRRKSSKTEKRRL